MIPQHSAPQLMDRIELIQRSLRVFSCGLWGLIPLFGLPMAITALIRNSKLRKLSAGQWNPAGAHLKWGVNCAWLGIFITFIALAVLVLAVGARLES